MVSNGSSDVVQRMMDQHRAVVGFLPTAEVSLRVDVDATFSKMLLLSGASYFEVQMTNAVLDIVAETTGNSTAIVKFVESRAVARRYHEWFAWDATNANHFFVSFGAEFAANMRDKVRESPERNEAIRAFMEMGRLRNQLVHLDFAAFPLDKTVDETVEMYQKALTFVETFPTDLREYIQASTGNRT